MPRLLTRCCRSALLATITIVGARAGVLLDTGVVLFSATGTQFSRIARDGTSATWGSSKVFPGAIGDGLARGYQTFTINNGPLEFLQISLDDPTIGLFVAGYLNSFNPVNAPFSYGLDINYLGDPGASQPFGNPSYFQIQVARNSTILLPINEISPGGGGGRPFELVVEGFVDANFTEMPEPGSFGLLAVGMATLAVSVASKGGSSK